jgi:cell division protein FtsL
MAQDPKTLGEDNEKSSFWEKLNAQHEQSKRKASLVKNSLVDAIVSQAEREASQPKTEHVDTEKIGQQYKASKDKMHSMLGFSKTILTLVVIASLGVWVYFYAVLSESNYFHEKINQQNLTTQVNAKAQYLAQLKTDVTDTNKFSKLLRIESLANQIVDLDLENPVLNYKRPQGEKVVSREDESGQAYRTVDASGKIVYLAEADVVALENARDIRAEFVKNTLSQIIAETADLKSQPDSNAEIEKEFKQITETLTTLSPNETNFPSAITKENYQAAQFLAQSILTKVKDLNLKNLVTDIKKQADAIDTNEADVETKAVVSQLKEIIAKITAQRLTSFEKALGEAAALDVDKITNNDIYQKVIRITGTPGKKANDGDLAAATVIAHNLGKVNIINQLKANRIAWSNVIERVEKIARLGSDLERDAADVIYTDSRADIDPNGKYVTFTGYAGKINKNEIEVRGNALGEAVYKDKNFTLLADLIDAFEGSKYFKDVEGFSFAKNKNRQDEYFAPLNFQLKLQNPSTTESLDIKQSNTRSEAAKINLDVVKDLKFTNPKSEAKIEEVPTAAKSVKATPEKEVATPIAKAAPISRETISPVESTPAVATPRSEAEATTETVETTEATISTVAEVIPTETTTTDNQTIDVFGYLDLILNNSKK